MNMRMFTYCHNKDVEVEIVFHFKAIVPYEILPEEDDTKGDGLHVEVDDY